MNKVFTRGAIWLGIAAVMVAAALAVGPGVTKATPVPGDGANTVDVVPADSGQVAIGANFHVDIDLAEAELSYAGFQFKLAWDDATVDYVNATYSGPPACLAGPPATGPGSAAGSEAVWGGCAGAGLMSGTGPFFDVELSCAAGGTTALHLESAAEDPTFGTATGPSPGVFDPMVLEDGTVECAELADVTTVKEGPATALAGDTFDYTITVHNAGPNPAVGVTLGDNLPEMPIPDDPASVPQKIYVDHDITYNGAPLDPATCTYYPVFVHPLGGTLLNVIFCNLADGGVLAMLPSDEIVLTVTVTVPLYDAGKLNVNTAQAGSLVTGDPDMSNEADCAPLGIDPGNIGCAMTQVLPSLVSIEKTVDPGPYSEGDAITYTVTVDCGAGGSPCSDATGTTGPVVVDTVDANQVISAADVDGNPADCVVASPTATCTIPAAMAPGSSAVITVVADVVDSEGSECTNDADVTYADPVTIGDSTSVICLPPTVRMEKDIDEDATSIVNEANLFLEVDPATGDLMCLDVYELVSNVANDPDGAGAYEFQLKFDHKLFDISIEDASWLSNGGTRDVECDMTVITENWILFGCVSTGPVPGNTSDGTIAIIHVCPEPDMVNRIRPSNDNGVYDELLDENCEIADPLGHPLEIEGWCCDGLDNDGDGVIDEFGEGLAPGVLPGGMIEECSDFGITLRILEGDLNLDCAVDVLDQQAIAFRYGATFGVLLYDDWYDLEPWVPDFDIDIKDLQKVFGRDGSTCEEPIPAQPPVPFPF